MDVDCRYALTERTVAPVSKGNDSVNNYYTHDHISDNKAGQKSRVRPYDSDQVSLTIYNDISHNLLQKQQNGSSDSKDDNRYDKKLNQPNIKPSISNVFNSLNEYINAPTGSLNYIDPDDTVLDEADNLPCKMPADHIPEKDVKWNRDVTVNEYSTLKEKETADRTSTNVLDYKNILPKELGTFGEAGTTNRQDNIIHNVTSLHSTSVQSERNNAIISAPSMTDLKYEHDNVTMDTELYNDASISEKITANSVVLEQIVADEREQLDSANRDATEKQAFSKNEKSTIENTTKLSTTTINRTEDVDTARGCDSLSDVHTIRTIDVAGHDFSEEELNRYLLELEEEERSKRDVSCMDTSQKAHDKTTDVITSQYRRDDEDVNEAPVFERIMIGELPKISEEGFQEKAKKFPVIDYSTSVRNENVIDAFAGEKDSQELDNTVKLIISNEKSHLAKDAQINELEDAIKDNDVIKMTNRDAAAQENVPQTVSNVVVEERATSKIEGGVGEHCSHINATEKTQQNISTEMRSHDNDDGGVVKAPSENTGNCNERAYHDASEQSNKESTQYDGTKIPKTEITSKIDDASINISHTNESSQEVGKLSRPQTLDIVSTHNKEDSHTHGTL